MIFTSYYFLFYVLPIIVIVYFFLSKYNSKAVTNLWLAIASFLFYAIWSVKHVPILFLSIAANYGIAQLVRADSPHSERKRYFWLCIGVAANLIALGFFKYYGFFLSEISQAGHLDLTIPKIVLPLGMSFFTFHQIAYLLTAHQSGLKYNRFIDYAMFVSFFPQLIAGPIVMYKDVMPQIADEKKIRYDYRNIAAGLFIFAIGLAKKIILADSLAPIVEIPFDKELDPTPYRALFGSVAYVFQLYLDFSGYIDMAVGLALIFNIRLPHNFNSPLKALNITDFWRRWHITLTQFLTTYLYNPIALKLTRQSMFAEDGKVAEFLKTIAVPTMITFFLAGVWHGAGWNFFVFGLFHGVGLVVHRLWTYSKIKLPVWIAWPMNFLFIWVGFVIFRAQDMTSAKKILKQVRKLPIDEFFTPENTRNCMYLAVSLIVVFWPKNSLQQLNEFKPNLMNFTKTAILIFISLFFINVQAEFLYWQF